MGEETEYRYLFTVRQEFGDEPSVDAFYEMQVPAGITGDHAKVMRRLKENWCDDEIRNDVRSLEGMRMRLRFNSDMYQHVCLVRTTSPITADDLDGIVKAKHTLGELKEFLDESAVK